MVKDGDNGLLADNTPEAWADALCRMIRDSALRRDCVENAIDYLQENHSEDAVIARLEEGIPEILLEKQSYRKCGHFEAFRILYYLSRVFDWLYMTSFYLKRTGIRDVFARMMVHIKGHAYSRR